MEKEYGADYLANFNSKFNALDVIYLVRKLGYGNGHVNLYGGSYGTLLAQHVLALSPGDVHSVVLAGVAPLGVDWKAEFPRNLRNSLQLIFDACNTSPSCKEAYPNLEHTFFQLLGQLKDQPLCMPVKDGKKTFSNVCLDDYGFLLALGHMLYQTESIKKIPRIIYGSWKSDLTQVAELGENYYADERDENSSWGMHYSIYCSEFSRFDPDGIDLAGVEQQFQTTYTASKQLIKEICPENRKSYGDIGIVNNKVPVLIFNGKFDPVTPAQYGKKVADILNVGDDYQFTFESRAHDSVDECAVKIMSDFFDNPKKAPEDNCWEDENKPIEFELLDEESGSPWWQDLPQRITEALKQMWQELKKQIEDTVNQWWQDFQNWLDQQWQNFQKWLEQQLEKWWQDFQKRLVQWIEQLLTELINQCLPSALLPVGVSAGVWISRRRQKR